MFFEKSISVVPKILHKSVIFKCTQVWRKREKRRYYHWLLNCSKNIYHNYQRNTNHIEFWNFAQPTFYLRMIPKPVNLQCEFRSPKHSFWLCIEMFISVLKQERSYLIEYEVISNEVGFKFVTIIIITDVNLKRKINIEVQNQNNYLDKSRSNWF